MDHDLLDDFVGRENCDLGDDDRVDVAGADDYEQGPEAVTGHRFARVSRIAAHCYQMMPGVGDPTPDAFPLGVGGVTVDRTLCLPYVADDPHRSLRSFVSCPLEV